MLTAPSDENDWTPEALQHRIGNYVRRIVAFNSGWGIPGRGKRPDGFFGHFFRFDANRMTRMVLACEHLIRCMIIWMALRAYRDDGVQPANYRLPSGGPRGPRSPEPPMDPIFRLRALPLREPRLPPFLISLPEPKSPYWQEAGLPHHTSDCVGATALSTTHRESGSSLEPVPCEPLVRGNERECREAGGQTKMSLRATGSSKPKRLKPRNDQILDCNLLVERAHRLSKLLDEIDPRARRLAARWAGYLTNSDADGETPLSPGGLERCENDPVNHFLAQGAGGEGEMKADPNSSLHTSNREGAGRLSRRRKNEAEQKKQTHETGSVCSPPWKGGAGGGSSFSLNPLKTCWPPPDLLNEAAEDEAEDLKELHDVALRATEAFHELCG